MARQDVADAALLAQGRVQRVDRGARARRRPASRLLFPSPRTAAWAAVIFAMAVSLSLCVTTVGSTGRMAEGGRRAIKLFHGGISG